MQPFHESLTTVINAGSMAGDITSSVLNVNNIRGYCVQAVWAGASSPLGDFIVQGVLEENGTFTNIQTTALSGNDGSILVNVESPMYGFVRCFFDWTSGSGSLTVKINTKKY
jgi:hypothetical protein